MDYAPCKTTWKYKKKRILKIKIQATKVKLVVSTHLIFSNYTSSSYISMIP